MEIKKASLQDLRHAEYNPRILTEAEAKHLQKSIEEFGFLQPLIVNSHHSRKGIIVGGNQRFEILKRMGHIEFDVVFVEIEDPKKERELNLRLNRNQGRWNWDELANCGIDELIGVGFTHNELEFHFGEWHPDFNASKKNQETDSGIISTIKVLCPQHMRGEVEAKIRTLFEGISDVVIA